jgi:2-iminobutanoate/2-iminopropanoate deaminase
MKCEGTQDSMASRKAISTANAPAAIGPYSQGISCGELVFTSGQIPIDPESGGVVAGGIREQTARVMENLEAILNAAGTSLDNAVKMTCYLSDLKHFAEFNKVYSSYFVADPPVRSTVQVAVLPLGVLVEVDCVAAVR